jgi:hypothetical protein
MKLKYIGMLLSSLGVVTALAAVPAQQDPGPDLPKPAAPSADAAPTIPVQNPLYGNDTNIISTNQPVFYGNPELYTNVHYSERSGLSRSEAELAHQTDELKKMLEQAKGDAQRSEVRTKLAENLGKQFDLRQKRHGLEIEALETQVKKLKELVRKRQESREDIIARRLDQVQREVDGLGW